MVVVERNTGDRENRQQRGRIRKEWEGRIYRRDWKGARDRRMRGGWRETGQERWRSGFRFIFRHCCTVVDWQPTFPPNSCLLIPRRVQPSFSSTKAADPSPGIAKEQTRGRIYCSYCNVDESPVEFREPAIYFRRFDRLSLSIYIRICIHIPLYIPRRKGIVPSSSAR